MADVNYIGLYYFVIGISMPIVDSNIQIGVSNDFEVDEKGNLSILTYLSMPPNGGEPIPASVDMFDVIDGWIDFYESDDMAQISLLADALEKCVVMLRMEIDD